MSYTHCPTCGKAWTAHGTACGPAGADSLERNSSASEWKWDGRYPVRCQIVDVTGKEVMPGIEGRTPDESRPHVGKTGTARRVRGGRVEITLDGGGVLMGYECWWVPLSNNPDELTPAHSTQRKDTHGHDKH